MASLIAGLIAVYLIWVAVRRFTGVSPAAAATLVRKGGAAVIFVVALLLLLRGNVAGAVTLGALSFSLGLWGGTGALTGALGVVGLARRRGAATSVRSATIEMRLDRTSGAMSGSVLAGPLRGRELDGLTRADCLTLHADCQREDPDGARLLETYLDRRFAGWRQADQSQSDEGGRRRGGEPMSRDHAYKILGLPQGASAEEIIRAHRALMKKLHPDLGGSTALAVQINEAKDVLLRHG